MSRHVFEFKQLTPEGVRDYITRNFSGVPCSLLLKTIHLWMGNVELRELFHTARTYDGSNHSLVVDSEYLRVLDTTKLTFYVAGGDCHSSLGEIRVSLMISGNTTNEPMTMEIQFRNNNIDYAGGLLKVLGAKSQNNIPYTLLNGMMIVQFANEDFNQVLDFLYSIRESYRTDRPVFQTKNWR